MQIKEITQNKESFMDILLIGDEQENMVSKYLKDSILYALYDNEHLKSVCAVIKNDKDTIEIKNLATYLSCQNKGYATALIEYVCKAHKSSAKYVILGTGENLRILNFYEKLGFRQTHRIKDFFIKNYDHPIFEQGKQLVDMIYLKKEL